MREIWLINTTSSLLGPIFAGARRPHGKWTMDPPQHVRQFLNLVESSLGACGGARLVLGDFAQFNGSKPVGSVRTLAPGVGSERAAEWRRICSPGGPDDDVRPVRSRRPGVTLRCEIDAPRPEEKPRKPRKGDILDLRGLADHLGVEWRAGRVIGSRPVFKGKKCIGHEPISEPTEKSHEDLVGSIRHRLYKSTRCGIGFASYDWGVCVSGYAEGIDAECPHHELGYPFSPLEFDAACDEADAEGCDMFDDTHGCAHCGLGDMKCDGEACKVCADETKRDYHPIDENCVACGGAGTVF